MKKIILLMIMINFLTFGEKRVVENYDYFEDYYSFKEKKIVSGMEICEGDLVTDISDYEVYDKDLDTMLIYSSGTLSYFNGDVFVGEFSGMSVILEFGKMYYGNGDVYEGAFSTRDNNNLEGNGYNLEMEGKGILTYANGNKFIGSFKDNQLEIGKMYYKNGNIYDGTFDNNKFNGDGIFIYKNKDKYIGEFKNNRFDGFGTFVFSNKDIIEGNWREGDSDEKIVKKDEVDKIKKLMDNQKFNFMWGLSSKQDSFGGYFDIVYSNGLWIAVPNKFIENRNRDNLKNQEFTSIVSKDENGLTKYFFGKKDVNWNIEETNLINYIDNFDIPTEKEIVTNDGIMNIMKYQYILGKYKMNEVEKTALYTKIDNVEFRNLKENSDIRISYFGDSDNTIPVLVKKTGFVFSDIISSKQMSIQDKIKEYAFFLTVKELTVEKRLVKEPVRILESKGEFESTKEFENRKNNWIEENKKYDEIYVNELKKAEKEYEEQKMKNENVDYIKEVYIKNLNKAISIILNKPYIKDVKYDADREKMEMTIYSSIDTSFTKEVEVSVPIKNAKIFKMELEQEKIIPNIYIDEMFNINKIEFVENEAKRLIDYRIVKGKNEIEGYEEFIKNNPNTLEAKNALLAINKIKTKDKEEEIKNKKQEENEKKKIKEYEEQEKKAYLTKKKVGDKVQVEAHGIYFSTHIISGYVEKVLGDKILIKISNPGGATSLNNDKIYVGAEIWDFYYNWMKK